jgi:hypothetical protein
MKKGVCAPGALANPKAVGADLFDYEPGFFSLKPRNPETKQADS